MNTEDTAWVKWLLLGLLLALCALCVGLLGAIRSAQESAYFHIGT